MGYFRLLLPACLLVAGMAFRVSGQNPPVISDLQLQSDIEDMIQSLDRTKDLSDLLDYFSVLRQHPVNINTADREELKKLLFLSDFQVSSLLQYREETGRLYSLNELQLIYGFDNNLIRRILPYITLGTEGNASSTGQDHGKHFVQEGLVRVRGMPEDAAGYMPVTDTMLKLHPNRFYRGDRTGLLFRYQIRYGRKFYAGILGDKDPGEPFFSKENKAGFDFLSWYVQYQGSGVIRQVNIGRYHLRFGQGLVLWNGFQLGKSSRALDINKRAPDVRYASSSSETDFMNGISTMLQIRNITIIPFFSYRRPDVHYEPDDSFGGKPVFSSFLTAGLHRTTDELKNKNNLREWVSGIHLAWRYHQLNVGMTSAYTVWDHSYQPPERPDNIFSFNGKENINAGLNYELSLKRVFLFGEAAVSKNGAPAFLQGLQWYFSPLISFSLLGRYYRPDYQAFYAKSFSETGITRNEAGLYMGFTGHPLRHITLTGYVDIYHFPWLRYLADAPSQGTETRLTLTWSPTPGFLIDIQYKKEIRNTNDPEDAALMQELAEQAHSHVRLQIRYLLMPQLQAVSRVDMTRFISAPGREPEKGFLICQDLQYKPEKLPIAVYGRFGLFDTRFATRIYTYENDLLYNFSIPSFTGQGIRWYVMLKYPLFARATMGIRVARTSYADRQVTGTGPSLISVPHKTEIKAQIRFRF